MSSNARAKIDMTAWAEVGPVANADAGATRSALGHRVVPAIAIKDCPLLAALIKGSLAVDVAHHAIAKLVAPVASLMPHWTLTVLPPLLV